MAKKEWAIFEEECRDWLDSEYGDLATFTLMGGSNSNVSDIKVECPNGVVFYVEVKAQSSQCSQFVLTPDYKRGIFGYSVRNKLEMNPFTQHLVDYMNKNFDLFCNPTTAGIIIDPNESEAAGHIRYQHMVKGVEFFLSRNNLGFVLIPLSFFGFYFDIEAVYRLKKSGSHNVPLKRMDSVNSWLKDNYNMICKQSGKSFKAEYRNDLINEELDIEGSKYMFRDDEQGLMTLRGLSSTQNPNVIFTISLKNDVEGLPTEYFRAFLQMVSR